MKKEEWLKQELWNKEQSFSKQLTDMFQWCMQRAEEMGLQQKELEQKLQESMQMRQQEEEKDLLLNDTWLVRFPLLLPLVIN